MDKMDEQVQRAMAKWPNVPHCYGWLGLDARGAWRMRDQRTQDLGLLGSKITNATLREFINRNYQAEEEGTGRYFFQNGPQRVYVELQSTPYIAHSDPVHGWVLHTGMPLKRCDAVWITKEGCFVLKSDAILAQIDDRDIADAVSCVYLHNQPVSDDLVMDWLGHEQNQHHDGLTFIFQQQTIPITPITMAELVKIHPFMAHPQP